MIDSEIQYDGVDIGRFAMPQRKFTPRISAVIRRTYFPESFVSRPLHRDNNINTEYLRTVRHGIYMLDMQNHRVYCTWYDNVSWMDSNVRKQRASLQAQEPWRQFKVKIILMNILLYGQTCVQNADRIKIV